jgi:predicted nuclease of restriction endonuclease-like (RecB) superfamily
MKEIIKRDDKYIEKGNLNDFGTFIDLIESSRNEVYKIVNTKLIDLYWSIGELVSKKIKTDGWGKSTVRELASYIERRYPDSLGFSMQNIWKMRQFYESYKNNQKLATLSREISWSHNVLIMTLKTDMQKEFYMKKSIELKYSFRELRRQINASLYERTKIYTAKNKKMIAAKPELLNLRDNYILEFLDLPERHTEKELEREIMNNLRSFISELGGDLFFVANQYNLRVENKDYYIDLLFYHHELKCYLAVELKTGDFLPKYMSQLDFYLEALDKQIKKGSDNPSIGLLLCASANDTVVEYALNRSVSPTMIAEYKLKLPDKEVIRKKIIEFRKSL